MGKQDRNKYSNCDFRSENCAYVFSKVSVRHIPAIPDEVLHSGTYDCISDLGMSIEELKSTC